MGTLNGISFQTRTDQWFQSGYEDVYDELEKYTYEEYTKDVPEGHSGFEADDTPNQRRIQDEVIEITEVRISSCLILYTMVSWTD